MKELHGNSFKEGRVSGPRCAAETERVLLAKAGCDTFGYPWGLDAGFSRDHAYPLGETIGAHGALARCGRAKP